MTTAPSRLRHTSRPTTVAALLSRTRTALQTIALTALFPHASAAFADHPWRDSDMVNLMRRASFRIAASEDRPEQCAISSPRRETGAAEQAETRPRPPRLAPYTLCVPSPSPSPSPLPFLEGSSPCWLPLQSARPCVHHSSSAWPDRRTFACR